MDQPVATVREFGARVFNGHERELAREYMTSEVVRHGNTVGTVNGVDTLVAVLGGFVGAVQDLHAEEQDVIARDDLVAIATGGQLRRRSGTCSEFPRAAAPSGGTRWTSTLVKQ